MIVFWLGYLNETDVEKWMCYAEENRSDIGSKLNDLMDEETYQLLFSVCHTECIWKGRLAYFYGFRIMGSILKVHTPKELLGLSYDDVNEFVLSFFGI